MAAVLDTEELQLADIGGGGPPDIGTGDDGRGGDGDGDGGSPDPRYVPGAGLMAMRLVMISVSVLFITVGIAYYERAQSPVNWEHIRVPPLLWLSTAVILASGWLLEGARGALSRGDTLRYLHWLEFTAGGGLAFLGCQVLALRELVSQGIYLRHNPHSSLFFVLTGGHGLHLLGGIAAVLYLMLSALRMPDRSRFHQSRQRTRTAITALYWHFLTVLWLAMFLGLLVWP